jgi:hypothetical protein
MKSEVRKFLETEREHFREYMDSLETEDDLREAVESLYLVVKANLREINNPSLSDGARKMLSIETVCVSIAMQTIHDTWYRENKYE